MGAFEVHKRVLSRREQPNLGYWVLYRIMASYLLSDDQLMLILCTRPDRLGQAAG